MPKAPIISERKRKLQQLSFAASSLITRNIPLDSCVKHILCRMSGSVITTFASGTPVADQFGTFDNLVPRIDVVIDGNRTIKNVKPSFMHFQQLLATKIQAERAASAAASAATDNYPTADITAFPYGSTTNVTTVRESVLISFENVYTDVQKELTWLNTKGRSSAEIRFTTASFSNLLGFGNTAPVVYSGSTIAIDILLIEQLDVSSDAVFGDWRQTTQQTLFSAQSTYSPINIPRGQRVFGVMMLTRDGAAGSTTTASGKLGNSLVVTNYAFWKDGQSIIKAGDFKELQADNRLRFGFNSPSASNLYRTDGLAYLDLWPEDNRGIVAGAVDARPGQCDSLQLYVDTNTSANCSYTSPASVETMTDELVNVA